jgi:hypothetical protein
LNFLPGLRRSRAKRHSNEIRLAQSAPSHLLRLTPPGLEAFFRRETTSPNLERTKQKSVSNYSGQRGVWAAVVTYTDGTKEKLGCIHEDRLVSEGGKQFYQTTFLEDEQNKAQMLINLLREKQRAIVTESARHSDGSLILPRNRIAYTGVVSIGDVIASGDPPSLRFQITGRYAQGQRKVQP